MLLTEDEKQQVIEDGAAAYAKYLDALRIDWRNDPHSADTPRRVAKAFVNDFGRGCYEEGPSVTAFDNNEKYAGMVFQGNIHVRSMCSHHHAPFMGVAHVAYIPKKNGKVIGLSKLNRIVDWFARRPQVQESLTKQIHTHIDEVCENSHGVAVMVSAQHTCCSNRGIKQDSTMKTALMSGDFLEDTSLARPEFYDFVRDLV